MERSLAHSERIVRLDDMRLPSGRIVVPTQGRLTLLAAYQRGVGQRFHRPRQASGMIGLGVVADHVINALQISQLLDVLKQPIRKRGLDRVD